MINTITSKENTYFTFRTYKVLRKYQSADLKRTKLEQLVI